MRVKIWDTLHDFNERTPILDVDVIYFDAENTDELEKKKYEQQLLSMSRNVPWSVKNEARMHIVNNMPPYFEETREREKIYEERLLKKKWQEKWHKVKIHYHS